MLIYCNDSNISKYTAACQHKTWSFLPNLMGWNKLHQRWNVFVYRLQPHLHLSYCRTRCWLPDECCAVYSKADTQLLWGRAPQVRGLIRPRWRHDKKQPDSRADCSPFATAADRRRLRDFVQHSKHFVQILTERQGSVVAELGKQVEGQGDMEMQRNSAMPHHFHNDSWWVRTHIDR